MMKCGHKAIKIGTSPPAGYPDPYGIPQDGSPCKKPPGGYGTDHWRKCSLCGLKEHIVMGKTVESIEG